MLLTFLIAVVLGKLVGTVSRLFGFGAGATWPGELALSIDSSILTKLLAQLKSGVVIVAGTNGKTTTSKMITALLEKQGKMVIHNTSGANLENGIVSAFLQNASWTGNILADYAVLEIDENTFPLIVEKLTTYNVQRTTIIVLLNLFRDQLDRYGEVDLIAQKWHTALQKLSSETTIILNADDPQVAYLGKKLMANVVYFGLDQPKSYISKKDHATDSTFCLACGGRLFYTGMYFSHIGIWKCESCGEKRPTPTVTNWQSKLPGIYNQYNATATAAVGKTLEATDQEIQNTLSSFAPAFGRQEEFIVDGKIIKIFLSKNPAGFTVSLRTVVDLVKAKKGSLLLVLNDRIPDGRDVSWIWDVDFEMLQTPGVPIIVSGDRTYDMALRIKYTKNVKAQMSNVKTNPKSQIPNFQKMQDTTAEPDLKKAIQKGLSNIKNNETLYVLSTYSAMLEVRKILTGKKIL